MLEAVRGLDAEARDVHRTLGDQLERSERLESLVEQLVSTASALRQRIERSDRALRADLNAVPYVAGDPFLQFASPVGDVTGYRSLGLAEDAASPYVGFEDLFRGPAERVTELQRPYLPLVAAHQPVLDIGCGRGEFLTLLASEDIAAKGVDNDPGMVARCQAEGLPVVLGDAIDYLGGVAEGSLGTIFCAQVIEHLPVAELRRLLDLAQQKLVPEGLFIAETVNPHSLPALKTFWVDLTHQHPIFPEVALAMCALAGFAPAYVFAPGYRSFEAARFASTSYAVVASSPPQAG
jgi:2-polyprenyl-3-methyl-5-hydroxy-6-metoxy-1,4-benzoquinol methylase